MWKSENVVVFSLNNYRCFSPVLQVEEIGFVYMYCAMKKCIVADPLNEKCPEASGHFSL
jgi:hypothetical protein